MSKIKRLAENFGRHIALPWRDNAAAAQRVIFCVYDPAEERALRYQIGAFELASIEAGHDWNLFDLTGQFPEWMGSQRYAENYLEKPDLLPTVLHRYLEYICGNFEAFLDKRNVTAESVVAVLGVGTLFGFLKVKQLVDQLAPKVPGRLVVLFPGSYEGNNYRLLDAYDGWNYLAIPITADKEI